MRLAAFFYPTVRNVGRNMVMKRRGLAYLTAILAAIVMLVFTGCPDAAPIYVYVYSVTVQTGIANGSISASPTSSAAGNTITLTITPASGYFLSSLNVIQPDGTEVPVSGSGETRTFTMPPSHVIVSGVFGNRYSVIVQAGIENGLINPSPASSLAGNTITLTITPNTGYILKANSLSVKQTDDGTEVQIDPDPDAPYIYTFTMPASHVTVSGEFEKEQYSVTVQEGIANGSISASPTSAAAGDTVTLTITPITGYILKESSLSVKTDDEDETEVLVSGSGETRTFTMPAANVTISGEFGIRHDITVQAEIENGSISASAASAAEEDTITLTITPHEGYFLDSLSVKQTGETEVLISGSGRTRTFTMPASDVTVSGKFEEIAASPNNTINIHFEGFYDEVIDLTSDYENDLVLGSGQELNVSVPEGYDNYYWYVNGEPWAGSHVLTFIMDADIWNENRIGVHTITVVIQIGEIFYSKNLIFRIVW